LPEHRQGTPSAYVTLESFLWRDFCDSAEWREWARKHALGSAADGVPPQFRLAMGLQRALRALELENNGGPADHGAAAQLNALIARFKVQPRLSPAGEISVAAAHLGNSPVARLLIMAVEAMQSGTWRRFKLCREPTCSASFYDASKSGTKIWCSMALCGSRDKMRRLRQRRRG